MAGKDSDDTYDVPAQVNMANQLPPNMVLLKMENETMMAAAAVRPRSPVKIVAQLREMIEAFPQSADDAIYSKPVGKIKRVTCGDCKAVYEVTANKSLQYVQCSKCGSKNGQKSDGREVMKFAEGLSIRAAESIRSIFGYTRLATTTEILDNGSARITGIFVDYAAGNITSDERIVSNYFTTYTKEKVLISEDRFLSLNVKAEKSKLRRDIILDSVPNEVKAAFVDACEKKLAGMVTPEIVKTSILPWFAERGISQEHLERMIGRPLTMGWTEQDRLQIKKVASALKNDEISVAELIRVIEGKAETQGANAGRADDLEEKLKNKAGEAAGDHGQGGGAGSDVDPLLKWEARIEEAEGGAAYDKILDDATKENAGLTAAQMGRVAEMVAAKRKPAKGGTQKTMV